LQIDRYTLPARDGFALSVTAYRPATPRYGLLINSATGIDQRFYQHFARHASARGAWVVSYDYRGIAGSRDALWQGDAPRMAQWGSLDMASMIDHMPQELPLAMLGHSVGGQLPGLVPNIGRVQALLGVAAQWGYWRLWPLPQQLRLALMWYLAAPLAIRVFGKMPGWLMGGEDLPLEVAREWSRWCRSPAYMSTEQGHPLRPYFADVAAPARFLCISDDLGIAPERAVRTLAALYTSAQAEMQTIKPQDWGLRALGHFGFFRRSTPSALWDQELAWIERVLKLDAVVQPAPLAKPLEAAAAARPMRLVEMEA
jgi:predicted alpha/beta hydrolase